MIELHMMLFMAPIGVGKMHLALDLLKREYFSYFDFVIIPCSTLKHNEIYCRQMWFWTDPYVILIEPGNHLYDWIEKLSAILARHKTLFLIDDITANETLEKWRQPLLGLAISGRHKGHSLWLLMQSYIAIPMNIRRQAKMLYFGIQRSEETGIWFIKRTASSKCQRSSECQEEAKTGQAHLFGNENRASESLQDYVVMKPLRDCVTMKPLQDTYSTAAKRLQNSCHKTTALLPRDYSTPVKRLQHSYRTLIRKMIEYLSFLLQCTSVILLGATTCYL